VGIQILRYGSNGHLYSRLMSRKIALEGDSKMNIINIKTKIKPSNKSKSGAYSWRNKALSKNPTRNNNEHNQTIIFPAGETRPKEAHGHLER
jgi:hypothetical protein